MPKGSGIFILGASIGAVVITILAFSMGWVVTSGRANASATEMSSQAVKDNLVPICMHQAKNDVEIASKLESLGNLDQWKREGFVAQQGWETMPGGDEPESGVARECASRLVDAG